MKDNKAYKSIPASENGSQVRCKTASQVEYLITQCVEKERFTLWKVLDDGFEKVETSGSPLDLNIPWQN